MQAKVEGLLLDFSSISGKIRGRGEILIGPDFARIKDCKQRIECEQFPLHSNKLNLRTNSKCLL